MHHFGNQAEAEAARRRLAVALPACPPAQISALPAVLAAHAGLGVLAVIVGEGSTPAAAKPDAFAGDVASPDGGETPPGRAAAEATEAGD